jgi:hypothetical protein
LAPVRKQSGLNAGAFSLALLVPVATTGTNGLYKPRLKAFFPPMSINWVTDANVSLCLKGNQSARHALAPWRPKRRAVDGQQRRRPSAYRRPCFSCQQETVSTERNSATSSGVFAGRETHVL